MKMSVLAVLLLSIAARAAATTTEVGPADNWTAIMQGLQPGDTLIMDDGTYVLNGYFSISLHGTSASPILIRAQDGARPVIQQNADQNIVNILGSTYLTIDGLTFTGGSIGLRFLGSAATPAMGGSDITIRNCHIHDTPANAIAANSSGVDYARFSFIHNEIDHTGDTGEGFYLGCNNNECQFHDSLIANNYIHDLDGATVTQGDGIEIKQGSYANVVQDNVIHDTGYPGITMYGVSGNGAVNIIQRNIVWNSGDNGIQVTADAIVRNNIVLSECSSCAAFASNAIQGASAANLTIVNNTFLAPGSAKGIRLNGVSGTVIVANNAIYAPNGNAIYANGALGGVTVVANAGAGSLSGVASGFDNSGNIASDFFSANLSGVPPQNLVPKGNVLVGTANASYLPSDDFSTNARTTADIGAYRAVASGNPGWPIQAGFKVDDQIFANGFEP
ncbi:MAG: right-handed parallel beta-helix repeat-containing protein [Proteobacteria bacterium]|nr:right-handed parallel beta-helix repeat-containing protein [Pseudomonadota bacterium]